MNKKSIIRVLSIATALLLIPLAGELFVDGWNWGVGGFVFAWVMFSCTGLGFTFVASKGTGPAYKGAVALATLGVFMLIWVNAAVGIIGSEDNGANLMYFGVLIAGLAGCIISRLRPGGMARTMFIVAIIQMLVPTVALLFWDWNHGISFGGEREFWGNVGVLGVFSMNAFFAALWLVSALLFRRAVHNN